tara:strand:- start:532 stop:897 length:366 start_codon:yes stop_codon:yes gene_type:complete
LAIFASLDQRLGQARDLIDKALLDSKDIQNDLATSGTRKKTIAVLTELSRKMEYLLLQAPGPGSAQDRHRRKASDGLGPVASWEELEALFNNIRHFHEDIMNLIRQLSLAGGVSDSHGHGK